MSPALFRRLKASNAQELLLYIHGFSNTPEDVFQRASDLQSLLDKQAPGLVEVLTIMWPTDDDPGVLLDYWDDQATADASAPMLGRLLGKFLDWQKQPGQIDVPCLKRINVLSHSMGNRVLVKTIDNFAKGFGGGSLPYMFRNLFMIAADVPDESLESGQPGRTLTEISRNVVVYYANDDKALMASRGANGTRVGEFTRRLGHYGPENMDQVQRNVCAVDCDGFNGRFDQLKGHSYFLTDQTPHVKADGSPNGAISPALLHMIECMKTGRVGSDRSFVL
ncbi:MAG: alpha/beta hydrolase [Magnetococcales bacterium]|nr:alpha/beta hydrolase [Magnetococcales bacterium]